MQGLETAVDLWGVLWALIAAWLLVTRGRRGSLKTASLLIVLGAGLLSLEDPTLLLWMSNATPIVDRDGVVGLVRPHTIDHMVGGAAWAFVGLGAAAWVATTRLRSGEFAAWWFLVIAMGVGGGADLLGLATIFSHGLPIPGAASAEPGFGWIPIVVALVAWMTGLAIAWPSVRRRRRDRAGLRDAVAGRRIVSVRLTPSAYAHGDRAPHEALPGVGPHPLQT